MVYLICFEKPYKHARHYIGFARDEYTFKKRIEHHRKGRGALLLSKVVEAGIGFEVVRTWLDGDRNFERKLKNRKKSSDLCPHCKAMKKNSVETAKGKDLDKIAHDYDLDVNRTCPVVNHYHYEDMVALGKGALPAPIVEKSVTLTKAIEEFAKIAERIYCEKPKNHTNPSRWARIWSFLARLWSICTFKRLS